jgi:hypothetical protein
MDIPWEGKGGTMQMTLTLDDDLAMALREEVKRNDRSFRETVSSLLRRGLRVAPAEGPAIVAELPDEELRRILGRLKAALADVQAEYRDVARCEQTWRGLQRLVAEPLWEAVEGLDDDRYRRHLADVLDAAVARLQAFQLDDKHLAAIDSTLARLAAPRVTERDVHFCEKLWEAVGVNTVPSLGDSFEEWLELSGPDLDDDVD